MKHAEVENKRLIREQITEYKQRGEDTSFLVARLIELDKIPRKSKKPKVRTP